MTANETDAASTAEASGPDRARLSSMRDALRIYRERMRSKDGSPRGTFWYQSPFRSNWEGFAIIWLILPGFLIVSLIADLAGWSGWTEFLLNCLAGAVYFAGWFAWIVWGRDAFPLPDKEESSDAGRDLQSDTEDAT